MGMNTLQKKSIYQHKKKLSSLNLEFIHKILDTVNISLLCLIFILSFLSLNSQRQWSNLYVVLSKTRERNNNLIDYISKTEEFYISKFESLGNIKKTTPKDLVYLKKIPRKKENSFDKKFKILIKGSIDSRYQIGY